MSRHNATHSESNADIESAEKPDTREHGEVYARKSCVNVLRPPYQVSSVISRLADEVSVPPLNRPGIYRGVSPMAIVDPESVLRVLKDLQKQGKAIITVNLRSYANDQRFSTDPPSCRVTVRVTNPDSPAALVFAKNIDIDTHTPPYSCQFIIPVETWTRSMGRFFRKKKSRPLDVSIVAVPIDGYDELYEADRKYEKETVAAGADLKLSVALKPKPSETRNFPSLDKPLFKNKSEPRSDA